jgi:hypothetical protein
LKFPCPSLRLVIGSHAHYSVDYSLPARTVPRNCPSLLLRCLAHIFSNTVPCPKNNYLGRPTPHCKLVCLTWSSCSPLWLA